MYIIPAIDIRRGNVVRLLRGLYNRETVYSHNPLEIAQQWKEQGAEIIHVIDLDGAFWGGPKNLKIIEQIVKKLNIKIHLGGGLRSIENIKQALDSGVHKVILSTAVFEDESFLQKIEEGVLKKIIVSIDSRNGFIQAKGWTQQTSFTVKDAIKKIEKSGIDLAVVTDISCDGTLKGPNVVFLKEILGLTRMQIIASGGIAVLADITTLKQLNYDNLYGVIIGKALYEGKINLKEALRYAEKAQA